MRKYLLFIIPVILFSQELVFDLDKNISVGTLKKFKPAALLIDDTELKRLYNFKNFFAHKYLEDNKLSKSQREYLRNMLVNTLYNFEVDEIFKKEKINITDDIAYSYYLAHKDKYKVLSSVDIKVFAFKSKADAEKYDMKTNLPKPDKVSAYPDFILKNMKSNLALTILDLKENELSGVITHKSEYLRVYYTNKKESHIVPFDEIKGSIAKKLFLKKRNEILKKIYNKENK